MSPRGSGTLPGASSRSAAAKGLTARTASSHQSTAVWVSGWGRAASVWNQAVYLPPWHSVCFVLLGFPFPLVMAQPVKGITGSVIRA